MSRHDMPSGGWIELKDRSELTRRDRKLIEAAGAHVSAAMQNLSMSSAAGVDSIAFSLNADNLAKSSLYLDNLKVGLAVKAWSYDLPLVTDAKSAEVLEQLPMDDADVLEELTIKLFDNLAVRKDINPETVQDPKASTEPSSDTSAGSATSPLTGPSRHT